MFNMLSNVWNTTYLKWLFIFLFTIAFLHIVYDAYSYVVKDKRNYFFNSVLFFAIVIVSCLCVGCTLEVEKINANTRYEFITEDGVKHEGSSCYMTGGLFSTDGVYCKDYDGFTHTNVISYNRIVEVPDEN